MGSTSSIFQFYIDNPIQTLKHHNTLKKYLFKKIAEKWKRGVAKPAKSHSNMLCTLQSRNYKQMRRIQAAGVMVTA